MENLREVITRDRTQDHTHGSLLIDKLDNPIGRVATGEEFPSRKKRVPRLRNQKTGIPKWSANFSSNPHGPVLARNQLVVTHIGLR
jgi:hypothetical protein